MGPAVGVRQAGKAVQQLLDWGGRPTTQLPQATHRLCSYADTAASLNLHCWCHSMVCLLLYRAGEAGENREGCIRCRGQRRGERVAVGTDGVTLGRAAGTTAGTAASESERNSKGAARHGANPRRISSQPHEHKHQNNRPFLQSSLGGAWLSGAAAAGSAWLSVLQPSWQGECRLPARLPLEPLPSLPLLLPQLVYAAR